MGACSGERASLDAAALEQPIDSTRLLGEAVAVEHGLDFPHPPSPDSWMPWAHTDRAVRGTHSLTHSTSIDRALRWMRGLRDPRERSCSHPALHQVDEPYAHVQVTTNTHHLRSQTPGSIDRSVGPVAHQPQSIKELIEKHERKYSYAAKMTASFVIAAKFVASQGPHPQMTPLSLLTGFRQPR